VQQFLQAPDPGKILTLDIATLRLSLTLITVLTTCLLSVAALSGGARRELQLAALANVAVGAGFAIAGLPNVPLWVHGVLSYGVMGAGVGIAFACLRVFDGKPTSVLPALFMLIFTALGPLWFAYAEPSLEGRRLAATCLVGAGCFACAAYLLPGSRAVGEAARRITAIAFCVLGLALAGRALLSFGGVQLMQQTEAFNLLVIMAGQVAVMFGFVLMMENRRAQAMEQLSLTDALTGLLNRTGMQRAAARRLARAAHQRLPVAAVLFDVDHFKRINDSHGHAAGDQVLCWLAERTSAALRPDELIARHGGEEFLVLLLGGDAAAAQATAERLRLAVAQRPFVLDDLPLNVTVSLGVAHSNQLGHELTGLIAAADAALYEAKRAGRNCTRLGAVPKNSPQKMPALAAA
jgi:diguanylate cyclase (GGDEF)-like protein